MSSACDDVFDVAFFTFGVGMVSAVLCMAAGIGITFVFVSLSVVVVVVVSFDVVLAVSKDDVFDVSDNFVPQQQLDVDVEVSVLLSQDDEGELDVQAQPDVISLSSPGKVENIRMARSNIAMFCLPISSSVVPNGNMLPKVDWK